MYSFSYVFNSPCTVANNVETVNYNPCIWKQVFCKRNVLLSHVGNKVRYLLPVGECFKVLVYIAFLVGGKNIKDAFFRRRSQDALKFAILGIASEFIDGKHSRQAFRLCKTEQRKPTSHCGRDRFKLCVNLQNRVE